MSNPVKPPAGLGIAAPQASEERPVASNLRTEQVEEFDLPGGQTRTVRIRIGAEEDPKAAENRADVLRKIDTYAYTAPLEREIEQLEQRFHDYTGYDKAGQAIFRVQGRDREVLEMKLANRRRSLVDAQRTVREAAAFQEAERKVEAVRREKIHEAAEKRAEEIAEQAAIEKQAQQIARRKYGVG